MPNSCPVLCLRAEIVFGEKGNWRWLNDDDRQYLGATQLRYVDMWGAPCAKWGTIVWSQGNIPPLTSRQHAQIRRSSQILKKSFGCVFATLRNFNEFPGSGQYCMTLGPLPPLANPQIRGALDFLGIHIWLFQGFFKNSWFRTWDYKFWIYLEMLRNL